MTYGILRNWRVRWHALKHAQNSITASRTCKDSGYPNGGRKHSFQNHRFAEVLPGYVTQTLLARRKLFESVGNFNTSRRVGDPMDWFLRAGEQGATMELLPDLLVYARMHESNLSVEPGTRRMTPHMQDAIL